MFVAKISNASPLNTQTHTYIHMNPLWALLLWEDDLLDPSAVSSGIYLHVSECGAYMLFLDLSTWGSVYCLPMVGVDWMFYTHRPHPLVSGLSLPPMQLHDDFLVKSEFSAYMMVIWKDFFIPCQIVVLNSTAPGSSP